MEPQVIWIGIDPILLIAGFDYQGFFGADSFLKFNITPDETDGSTNDNSTNSTNAKNSEGHDTTFNGDIQEEKTGTMRKRVLTREGRTAIAVSQLIQLSEDEESEKGKDIKYIKSEQNIKSEFDEDFKPTFRVKTKNKLGGRIPSVCSECGLIASSMAKLEEHVKVVHNTALLFPCDHCDKKFSRKYLLEHKRFVVEGELKISCKSCEQKFARNRDLEAHMSKLHPEEMTKSHQCNICLKILRSSETLKYHERQNHREPEAQCQTCSKKFSTKKNFEWHMLQAFCDPAKRKREKQCDKCEMMFRRKHDLDCHTDSKHSDIMYPCKSEGCQKVVTSYRKLKYHMSEHHNEENIVCTFCHRKFAKASSRDIHMESRSCKIRREKKREAARNGQFKCVWENCEKKYATQTHLDRHIMIHTNERPYQCDDCGMAFSQKGTLKEHVRTHTGEKPYQCEECPNAYAQGGSFHAHLRSHKDAKAAQENPEVKTRPKVEIYHNNKKIF